MKLIAFIPGRARPQPRVTQKVKFLFSHQVEHWMKVDAENAQKAALGLLNKKGKPVKPTRFAYRLQRLQKINQYRELVWSTVNKACNGKIPHQNLFFIFTFHIPKSWRKKQREGKLWGMHSVRPDSSNLHKGCEDALWDNDGKCNAYAIYKIYVPKEYEEGLLILHDEEIHRFVIDTAIEQYIKTPAL
jgi:Holliday junction resolvase RusA-like endonuclease